MKYQIDRIRLKWVLFWLVFGVKSRALAFAAKKRFTIFTWRHFVYPIYDYYQFHIHRWIYAGKAIEWEFMSATQRKASQGMENER